MIQAPDPFTIRDDAPEPVERLKGIVRHLRGRDDATRRALVAQHRLRVGEARRIVGPANAPRDVSKEETHHVHKLLEEAEAIKALIMEHDTLPDDPGGSFITKLEAQHEWRDTHMHTTKISKFTEYFTKALGTNLLASGGALVPEEAAREVLTALQAEAVAFRAGIRQVEATGNPIRFPRITSDPAAAWIGESDTIPQGDLATGQVLATPRKLASRIVVSNELLTDAATSPTIVELLFQRLVQSLSLALDQAVFQGSGAENQPLGLRDRTDINVISMGANGAAFTSLDPFAEALRLIETANGRAGAIVMHPRTWGDLLKLKETTSSIRPVLIEAAGSPSEAPQRAIFGVPVFLTSQLSTSETQGSATNATSVYVFDPRSTFVVVWSAAPRGLSDRIAGSTPEIRVDLDSSRLFDKDQSELRAVLRVDIVVPHPAAVARIGGVVPA